MQKSFLSILKGNMTLKIKQDMLYDRFHEVNPSYQAGLGKKAQLLLINSVIISL